MRPRLPSRLWWVFIAAGCSTGAGAAGPGMPFLREECSSPSSPVRPDGPPSVAGLVTRTCSADAPCMDFAAKPKPAPDDKVPSNAADFFPMGGAFTDPLCVVEPQLGSSDPSDTTHPGALFPANWTRPRFRYRPAGGENLFEIRLHVRTESSDLVAYTTKLTWTLPADLWQRMGVGGAAVDENITVTIRGVNTATRGVVTGAKGVFQIAPVLARGSVVYRRTTSANAGQSASNLVGFHVGSETSVDVLPIDAIAQTMILSENGMLPRGLSFDYGVPAGHVQCIGCHTATPDGTSVGFTDAWPWDNVFATVQQGSAGAAPAWLSPGAQALMQQPWLGMMTMSPAHFAPGDRIALTSYEDRPSNVGYVTSSPDTSGASGKDKLAWFDLETTATIGSTGDGGINASIVDARDQAGAWGFLDLQGETAGVIAPNWSHDGKTIAYTSATRTQDGHVGDDAKTDIHLVPYNDKMGGPVTALLGASKPGVSEYYPAFSPDDRFIAFNRAESTAGKIFYRADGEVYVISSQGGTEQRLKANDPPACTGEQSPGVINSWPRWAPDVVIDHQHGRAFYWIVFTSARDYPCAFRVPPNPFSPVDTRSSQVYVAGVMVDASGGIHTYPAIYVWNQDPTTSNLTPAWDDFQIPFAQ